MGEAMTFLCISNLGLFLVAGRMFNLWQKAKLACDKAHNAAEGLAAKLSLVEFERDELRRQKTAQSKPAEDRPRIVTGAAARRLNERWNSENVFSPREQTNSEALKERENG